MNTNCSALIEFFAVYHVVFTQLLNKKEDIAVVEHFKNFSHCMLSSGASKNIMWIKAMQPEPDQVQTDLSVHYFTFFWRLLLYRWFMDLLALSGLSYYSCSSYL